MGPKVRSATSSGMTDFDVFCSPISCVTGIDVKLAAGSKTSKLSTLGASWGVPGPSILTSTTPAPILALDNASKFTVLVTAGKFPTKPPISSTNSNFAPSFHSICSRLNHGCPSSPPQGSETSPTSVLVCFCLQINKIRHLARIRHFLPLKMISIRRRSARLHFPRVFRVGRGRNGRSPRYVRRRFAIFLILPTKRPADDILASRSTTSIAGSIPFPLWSPRGWVLRGNSGGRESFAME